MVAVFLIYFTAAGAEVLAGLPLEGDSSTYYLPNRPQDTEVNLASDLDHDHSSLCLEIHSDFVLLRAFNETDSPCSVRHENGSELEIPLSSSEHYKSLVLRSDEHFFSPAGRWAIRWDDEQGTISNSMRPPPLPLVTRFQVGELEEEDLKDSLHEKADTCLTVSPGQSTTSTFCPSPSPGKQRDQTNISTEGTGASEYLSSQPEDLPPTEEIIGVEDKEHIMQTEPESHSDEEPGREGPAPSIESVEELASTAKGPEGCHTSEQDADTAVEALSSAVSIPPTQDLPHGTTPSPSDWLTKKRKFVHNEETDLQVDNSYGQLRTAQRDVVGDTIEVWTRSRRKATMLAHKSPSPVAPTKTTSPATFSRSQTQDPDEMGSGRRGAQDKSPPQSTVGPPAREDVGRVPVVVFSNTNIQENKTIMRSFASLGGRVTTSINKATILVVGDGPLKKTGKLIMAVSIGLDVATEQWIVETVNKGQTQNIRQFLPKDPSREQQWGFNLGQAIDRGKRGLTHLLAGTTVFFTKQLKRELGSLDREISQIATILGAEAVKHRLPALKNKGQYKEKELLIIGAPQDPQGAHAGRLGQKLFSKDILTMGALRGEIDRESSESILEVPVKDEENN